ncbi:MAG: ferritin family protein [Chloroflexi bacterium]|nr:ferritin family protein [Chloroflexota bacterium]
MTQEKIVRALETALRMEIDGKDFYLKMASLRHGSPGQELFEALSAEEDLHILAFTQIYESIRKRKEWPTLDFRPEGGGHALRSLFARAAESLPAGAKGTPSELEDIQTAVRMESDSYDFYEHQAKHAAADEERNFFRALAAQERQHQLVLLDLYEFLKDPAAWFVAHERPSLDAGI